LPYGDKSKDTLVNYSLQIVDFLIKQGVKAIVIACNSASAMAYQEVKEFSSVPIYNVIDPIVDHIKLNENTSNNVGLIATKATVNSNVYSDKIKESCTKVTTYPLATPLLVPMIEEGFFDDNISHTIISNYLDDKTLEGIDTLILGCTHYPFLSSALKKYFFNAKLIHSGQAIVKFLREGYKLLPKKSTIIKLFSSENPQMLRKVAQKWLDSN